MPVVEWADLHVDEIVLLRIRDGSITAGSQRVHQKVGVLLMGDSGYLNEIVAACGRCGCGRCR